MKRKIANLLFCIVFILSFVVGIVPVSAASNIPVEDVSSTSVFKASTIDNFDLHFDLKNLTVYSDNGDISNYCITKDDVDSYDSDEFLGVNFISCEGGAPSSSEWGSIVSAFGGNVEFTTVWSKCGRYNGKDIDMVVNYHNLQPMSKGKNSNKYKIGYGFSFTGYGKIENQSTSNEWFQWGFMNWDLDVSFQYTEDSPNISSNCYTYNPSNRAKGKAKKSIEIENGYLSCYSLDGVFCKDNKQVAYNTSGAKTYHQESRKADCDKVFIRNGGALINDNGWIRGVKLTGTSKENAALFYWEKTDKLNLQCSTFSDTSTGEIDPAFKGRWSEGYHLKFTPVGIKMPSDPQKILSSGEIIDTKDSTTQRKTTSGKEITFFVVAGFPSSDDEWKLTTLNKYEVVDVLDKNLEFVDVTSITYYDNSTDVFNKDGFNIKSTNQGGKTKVTVSPKSETLEKIKKQNGRGAIRITYKVKVKENANSNITNKAQVYVNDEYIESNPVEIKVYYPVTATYKTIYGEQLAPPVTKNYFVGESYTTDAKTFDKYTLTKTPTNASGKIVDRAIQVDYVYDTAVGQLTVKHINEKGILLEPAKTTEGKIGEPYTTSSKTFPGYELKETPTNANGKYVKGNTIVTYVYRGKETSVLVKYVTETGIDLTTPITIKGRVYDSYVTQRKDFKGYTLKEVPNNASGEMKEDQITVTYVYKAKDTSVRVRYVDESYVDIISPIIINGKVDETYTTDEKTFPGYELIKRPSNATGTMTEEQITVTYVYRLKDASVLVKYVDDEGNDLTPSILMSGKVGDDYITEEKHFDGYELTEKPKNASGEMKEDQITVTYVYKAKETSVLVKYVDDEDNDLTTPITIPGKVGKTYTTEEKTFPGYELTKKPDNASGKMTEKQIVVTYVYSPKNTSILVKYVDEAGHNLINPITKEGRVGDKYTTEEKSFKNYELIKRPSNATGTMTEEQIVVTYVYKLKETSVLVKYVDEEGNNLDSSTLIAGKIGDDYTTKAKTFNGYELTKKPDNASGKMTEKQIVVTYVYRLKDTFVFVKYVDEEGNELTNSITIGGKVGEKYTTDEKSFEGYELTETPNNASGEMVEEPIIVTYVYKLKDSSVLVKYVDEEGKNLTDSIIIPGKVGDDYTTNAKSFNGYELTETPTNANGKMKDGTIVVTYVYRLKDASVIVYYLNEDGNQLTEPIELNGKVFDEYITNEREFLGYELIKKPSNAIGTMTEETITVIYVYRLKDASVIVKYVDEDGNDIVESEKKDGKVGDKYSTEEKTFPQYELVEKPENSTGEMTEEQIIVTYVYRLKDATVLVRYVDEDDNEIATSVTLNGKVGDDYTTTEKVIEKYELTETPNNASGKMEEDQVIVTYVYKLKDSSVIVKYVDEDGNDIVEPEKKDGKVGDKYSTEEKTFPQYELVEKPENSTGEMTEEQIIVTYKYKKVEIPIEATEPQKNSDINSGSTNNTVVTSNNASVVPSVDVAPYTGETEGNSIWKLVAFCGMFVLFLVIFVIILVKRKKK